MLCYGPENKSCGCGVLVTLQAGHSNCASSHPHSKRFISLLLFFFQVENPSTPNDEGITPLHNAVCAGHYHIVKFLLDFGVNINAADSDGWYKQSITQ